MLFRGYWQLRDDSFRRFRTTLSSASTPLATRDGQVGGCTSSNTRQRARNEGGTWCNYFPSLWNRDAYVVRELRACFVPFLERILCLCLERESRPLGSVLAVRATSCGFVPSSRRRHTTQFVIPSRFYHPASDYYASSYFSFIRRPFKIQRNFQETEHLWNTRSFFFFFFPLFEVRSISLEQNRLQLDLENLSRYIHCWESVKCRKKNKEKRN